MVRQAWFLQADRKLVSFRSHALRFPAVIRSIVLIKMRLHQGTRLVICLHVPIGQASRHRVDRERITSTLDWQSIRGSFSAEIPGSWPSTATVFHLLAGPCSDYEIRMFNLT